MMKLVVLSCLLAAASASVLAGFAAPWVTYTAPWITPNNYRGPLSLAPGQPANIIAADGRPLDTLDVNLDRAAHYTAKGLNGAGIPIHVLKKRSLSSIIASPINAPVTRLAYAAPVITHTPHIFSAPIAHYGPLTYAAPYAHALY